MLNFIETSLGENNRLSAICKIFQMKFFYSTSYTGEVQSFRFDGTGNRE